MSSTSQDVDNQAARWVALRALGELNPEQQEEFGRWLSADKRHLGAYARAEGTLVRVDRAYSGGLEKSYVQRTTKVPGWSRRRVVLAGTAAAGMAAVALVSAEIRRRSREQIFATGIGQIREILLADGSVITLNTNSKVAVAYSSEMRNIRLVQGEAFFDVAKNKKRPFVVHADGTVIRAVGTSFTVSMLPQRPVEVLVKEGIVELKRTDVDNYAPVRARAKTKVVAPHNAPISAAAIATEKLVRDMAWQYGRIAFDDETLKDAAIEYARYSDVRIVVDPSVSEKTITGVFVSNDPIGFAKGAAAVLGLEVEVNGQEVRIFSRPSSNG
jgi:transmembrane sensor